MCSIPSVMKNNNILFQSFSKPGFSQVESIQEYIPLYDKLFTNSSSSTSSFSSSFPKSQLPLTWYLYDVFLDDDLSLQSETKENSDVERENEDNENEDEKDEEDEEEEDEEEEDFPCSPSIDYNVCKGIIKNNQTNETKEITLFIKYAPLLDPQKYLNGKEPIITTIDPTKSYLPCSPSFPSSKEINQQIHHKILDVNNAAYIDGFFSYLTSLLLHHYYFPHGVDFYGFYLGMKKEFCLNIYDDIETLCEYDFFKKNQNILFQVENFKEYCSLQPTLLNSITKKHPIIIHPLEEEEKEKDLVEKNLDDLDDLEVLDVLEMDVDPMFSNEMAVEFEIEKEKELIPYVSHYHELEDWNQQIGLESKEKHIPFTTTLKSTSSCSSNTSYTTVESNQIPLRIYPNEQDENDDDENIKEGISISDINDAFSYHSNAETASISHSTHSSTYEKDRSIQAIIPNVPVNIICMEKCENTLEYLINELLNEIEDMEDEEEEYEEEEKEEEPQEKGKRTKQEDEKRKRNYEIRKRNEEKRKRKDQQIQEEIEDKEKQIVAALMQIIMILITYQQLFSFTHNDLHSSNIMYVTTEKQFIYYHYNKQYYKVPTYGKIFKIIDFGRAIYKLNGQTFCSNAFEQGGDAEGQYNIEPYLNPKKKIVEPNMSFDLCRLACSLFDHFIDEMEDIPDLCEESKLIQLIVEWCTCDNGLNVLYKSNGKDRYPGFKLYKVIASSVTKHIPSNQLKNPLFQQFLIHSKKVNAKKEVIDIDKMNIKMI